MRFKNVVLSLALATGLLSALATPASAQVDPKLAAALARSAAAAGVPINAEETSTATLDGVSVATTSIKGFEQVPATDFAKGADFGYLYIDSPKSGRPAGAYKMRVNANPEDIQQGQYRGTVDLIDANGKVVRTLGADIGTSSLSVPDPLPFPRTQARVSIGNGGTSTPPGGGEPQGLIIITGWYHCPNGSWVYVVIIIWDDWWW